MRVEFTFSNEEKYLIEKYLSWSIVKIIHLLYNFLKLCFVCIKGGFCNESFAEYYFELISFLIATLLHHVYFFILPGKTDSNTVILSFVISLNIVLLIIAHNSIFSDE